MIAYTVHTGWHAWAGMGMVLPSDGREQDDRIGHWAGTSAKFRSQAGAGAKISTSVEGTR